MLFTRHRNTVVPTRLAYDRKATLQTIRTDAVNQTVNNQEMNIVLDERHLIINNSEKDLTRKERTTLTQLVSEHCRLLQEQNQKDVILKIWPDCGKTPHDVKHLFVVSAHSTTLTQSDLWGTPMDAIREFWRKEQQTEMNQTEMQTTTTVAMFVNTKY